MLKLREYLWPEQQRLLVDVVPNFQLTEKCDVLAGFPGWRIAARLGVPIRVRLHAHYDSESATYWADSPDLDGLVVAGTTLDELSFEANQATGELLELALNGPVHKAVSELRFERRAPYVE